VGPLYQACLPNLQDVECISQPRAVWVQASARHSGAAEAGLQQNSREGFQGGVALDAACLQLLQQSDLT
jgi:hypothetical protein